MGAGNQQERLPSEEKKRWFLAGVIEGEGSMCISIKKHPTAIHGFLVDPEFFIYQHRNRRELLELAQEIFATGRIFPFSARKRDILLYAEALRLFEARAHRSKEGLEKIVRIAYQMNHDGKQRQ